MAVTRVSVAAVKLPVVRGRKKRERGRARENTFESIRLSFENNHVTHELYKWRSMKHQMVKHFVEKWSMVGVSATIR